jgi:hypothetical protein
MDVEPESTSAAEFTEARKIASKLGGVWVLTMLANLLALRLRTAEDRGILDRISNLFSGAYLV